MPLPRYKCHKEVRAFKIDSIEMPILGSGLPGKAAILYGARRGSGRAGHFVPVDSAYIAKHKPVVGGYYVLYDDGYESFSPAAAFEAGYTLIEEKSE